MVFHRHGFSVRGARLIGLVVSEKKVSGTFCRNGPQGAPHKRFLTLFSCAIAWLAVVAGMPGIASMAHAEITFLNTWGTLGSDDGQFNYPSDVALSPSGQVYVTDGLNYRIQRFDADGTYETKWGSKQDVNGFDVPLSVAVSPSGLVYSTDELFAQVHKFDADGNFLVIGSEGPFGRTVQLQESQTLEIDTTVTILRGSTLAVDGGSLTTDELVMDGPGASFLFTSGTVDINTVELWNGVTYELGIGQTLPDHTSTFIGPGSTLTLNGGRLSTRTLTNFGGAFDWMAGTLNITNPAGLVIGSGGLLGRTVLLPASHTLDIDTTVTIGLGSTLTLSGGSLTTDRLVLDGQDASFLFSAGTVDINTRAGAAGLLVVGRRTDSSVRHLLVR